MSLDSLLSKSAFIIFKPGGVTGGLVVTSWAEVQTFIAYREGAVIVYVDDSIISPALVPGASGVTDCEGRLELRAFLLDSVNYSVLQIEDGATLHNLYSIRDVELRCNSQSATPSLSFAGTATGGSLILQEFGLLSQAATATQPGIRIPAGTTMFVSLSNDSAIVKEGFNDFTVPLFAVPLTALLRPVLVDASLVFNNFASGAGDVNFIFDNSSASEFFPTGTPPTLPGITGAYTKEDLSVFLGDVVGEALTTKVVAWQNKSLDPVTMVAPVLGDVPVFDGTKWTAAAGTVRAIDFAIGTAALQNSVTNIPATAIVLRCQVTITTPYTAGTTIEVGRVGNPILLQDTPDNNPTVVNEYDSPQRTVWGGVALVQVTIGGGPIAGAGFVTVEYTIPNP